MNDKRLTDQQRQGMSERINQIVQIKFRESQNSQNKSNQNYSSYGLKENSGQKSASKSNIWNGQSQIYYSTQQNSESKMSNKISRIKAAQTRIGSSSSQISVKREKSYNSHEQSESFNGGNSINLSVSNASKQLRTNHYQQINAFADKKKSLGLHPYSSQSQSKNFFSPHSQAKSYNLFSQHPYGQVNHNQYKQPYTNNFIQQKEENFMENNIDNINIDLQQMQQGDQQYDSNLYLEQIKIQELRIAQLEDLLKQETLNCEQFRSQISILKQQMLKSVSDSGLINLFEEAYIVSVDKQIDILVQLKEIQQKIEQDISSSQAIIIDQDNSLKSLIEQNQQQQIQIQELFTINQKIKEDLTQSLDGKKKHDQEKFYLIESNNKLVNDIENAIQQNSILIEENQHYIKQIDEKNNVISQLETLLKDQNENKSEQEAILEEKDQVIQKQIQDIYELNEELKEIKNQNEDLECLLKEYEEKIQQISEYQLDNNLQNSQEKKNAIKQRELEDLRELSAQQQSQEEEEDKQNQFEAIQANINNLERQVDILEQKNNHLTQQLEKNQTSIIQKDSQIIEKDKLLNKKDEQIKELQMQFQDKQHKADTFQKQLDILQNQLLETKQTNNTQNKQEEFAKIVQENIGLKANLSEIQIQFEQLKQQNIIHITANNKLQELVEENQQLLKKANLELSRQNQSQQVDPEILQQYEQNFEELNNRVIEFHQKYQQSEEEKEKLQEEIALLKNGMENDEKIQQLQYMQMKANFFSTQVVIMSKLLQIIDQEDECIEQDQYEPIVLQIKQKIEELLKENQLLKEQQNNNEQDEKDSQISPKQVKISQIQSLENSFSLRNREQSYQQNDQIQIDQKVMEQFEQKYEKQIEEITLQVQELQQRLAEVYEQKFILETYISQIKEFVPNQDVQELVNKYCETIQELITNEHCQKRLKENIEELEQTQTDQTEKTNDENESQETERQKNLQQLFHTFEQIIQQYKELIVNRDQLGQELAFLSEKENEKYLMVDELQQQNQQLYQEILILRNEYSQQDENDPNLDQMRDHSLGDQQFQQQQNTQMLSQFMNQQMRVSEESEGQFEEQNQESFK
ncbi:hypothetical protein TTHERM_00442950 (macronuclear) [Tetrahymena thermophila SB210]|uniref:Uncharacterized protein n=1 Tax=Tetrahymena thermophila (strain SB210) TaxID=312017 RepID=I7M6N7_TETTS|nr:hypothetical protein TTHERM_00442950 [Tetrahymena thermophila SB210]EAR85545.2 hypothetical protein TTHERM_00442950 [Tetrahymena thermophila SB210]|eukprot:XP_001033208.2 hypothetical protein TTHERM_00442950 [Tetrahymena thermophila SB210]